MSLHPADSTRSSEHRPAPAGSSVHAGTQPSSRTDEQDRSRRADAVPEADEMTSDPAKRVPSDDAFSSQLECWLRADGVKTVGGLEDVFGEKAFAVTILFLMFIPALPLPTGGITHVFALVTAIVALEMVLGIRTMWIPARLRNRDLGSSVTKKAIPFMVTADSLVRTVFPSSGGDARRPALVSQADGSRLHRLGGRHRPGSAVLGSRHSSSDGRRRCCPGPHLGGRRCHWHRSADRNGRHPIDPDCRCCLVQHCASPSLMNSAVSARAEQ